MQLFQKVRDAFVTDLETNARACGIELGKVVSKGWHQCKCPLCTDKSMSASLAHETGYLVCHQCGEKLELFKWYGKLHGLSDDVQSRDALAQLLHVELKLPKRRGGRVPKNLTPELLAQSVELLWNDDANTHLRKWFRSIKCDEPEILARLNVGALNGSIVVGQRWKNGRLMGQHRRINPGGKKTWSAGAGDAKTFQPFFPVKEIKRLNPEADHRDTEIVIFEGETDGFTAWCRERLWKQNKLPFWIHGVNMVPPANAVPDDWQNHRVFYLPDIDAFQGPDFEQHKSPSEKERTAALQRRTYVIRLGRMLQQCGLEVFLGSVPLNPVDHPKGDYRDFIEQGGCFDEIPFWPLTEILEFEKRPRMEVGFSKIGDYAEQPIRTRGRVQTIGEQIVLPEQTAVSCARGTLPICKNCRVPDEFPDGIIPWDDYRRVQASCLSDATTFERAAMRRALHKPRSCEEVELRHVKSTNGFVFGLGPVHPESQETSITVFSPDQPPLAGTIDVEGTPFHTADLQLVIVASKVTSVMDDLKLEDHVGSIETVVPSSINTLEKVRKALDYRAADLACHVTKIHGRRDIHLAFDLVAHTVLWFDILGQRARGWGDANVIGPTRTGKTVVADRLSDYYDTGFAIAPGSNASRAGLTIGQEGGHGKTRIKPGLFPMMHKQMIVIDEFHYLPKGLITDLQDARDRGRVNVAKNYGATTAPAAVRLLTISNESDMQLPCLASHVQHQYGTDESLARLDFSVGLPRQVDEERLPTVKRIWTQPICQALLRRARMMQPDQIFFEDGAIELAVETCRDLEAVYYDAVPFFTVEEKPRSILRMAISVANILFSHPPDDIHSCYVRKCHVEWAIEWLEHTYESIGYDELSVRLRAQDSVSDPVWAEALIGEIPGMNDPVKASRFVTALFEGMTTFSAASLIGLEAHKINRWLSEMSMCGVVRYGKDRSLRPTRGGADLLRKMEHCAVNYPDRYKFRHDELRRWRLAKASNQGQQVFTPQVSPLTESWEALIDEWEQGEMQPTEQIIDY